MGFTGIKAWIKGSRTWVVLGVVAIVLVVGCWVGYEYTHHHKISTNTSKVNYGKIKELYEASTAIRQRNYAKAVTLQVDVGNKYGFDNSLIALICSTAL